MKSTFDGTLAVAAITTFTTLVPFAGWAGFADHFRIPLDFVSISFSAAARFWCGPLGVSVAVVLSIVGLGVGVPLAVLRAKWAWYARGLGRRVGIAACLLAVALPAAINTAFYVLRVAGLDETAASDTSDLSFPVLTAIPIAWAIGIYFSAMALLDIGLERGSRVEFERSRKDAAFLKVSAETGQTYFPSGWGPSRIAEHLRIFEWCAATGMFMFLLAIAFSFGRFAAANKTHFIAVKDGDAVVLVMMLAGDKAIGYALGGNDCKPQKSEAQKIINALRVVPLSGAIAAHMEMESAPSLDCLGGHTSASEIF